MEKQDDAGEAEFALLTAGPGDIGGAICRHLAREGMDVWGHSFRNRDRAEMVVEAIKKESGSSFIIGQTLVVNGGLALI